MPGLHLPRLPAGIVETCETSGILNSAVNLVASIAATEALKVLVGGSGPRTFGELFSRSICGPTSTRKFPRQSPVPGAEHAESTTSFTWRARGVRTSRCAAGIRFKFMSGNGQSTSPKWIGGSNLTASCDTTTSF